MREKISIEDMQKLAKEKGGKCLSDKYTNNHTKLKWRCAKGHKWWATYSNVQKGTWCPDCGGSKKLTIEDMHSLVEGRGKFLSTKYVNARTRHKWECNCGNTWWATPSKIQLGRWCPICGRKKPGAKRMFSTEFIKTWLSKNRQLELISKYEGVNKSINVRCSEGHKSKMIFSSIYYRDAGCSECSGRSERLCRMWFESLFKNKKFPKKRPAWLINPITGRKLELDGYNKELGIAFEYQGIQHFEDIFKIGGKKFEELKQRDEVKRKLCKKNNVSLLEIPYFGDDRKGMGKYIYKQCKLIKKNTKIVPNFSAIDYNTFDIYPNKLLKEIGEIAKQKEGKCLSQIYLGYNKHLEFECKYQHKWSASPANIKKGTWCPDCGGNKKKTFKFISQKTIELGWKPKFKESDYKNTKTPLPIVCKNGHLFKKSFSKIQSGEGCRKCYETRKGQTLKLNISVVRREVAKFNWKAIFEDDEYKNTKTPLRIKCKNGHIIYKDLDHIRRGQRCHICLGTTKLSIEEMQKIAKSRGGKCLSDKYINARTKLKWQCKENHIWEAVPDSVKRGNWCKKCFLMNKNEKK